MARNHDRARRSQASGGLPDVTAGENPDDVSRARISGASCPTRSATHVGFLAIFKSTACEVIAQE